MQIFGNPPLRHIMILSQITYSFIVSHFITRYPFRYLDFIMNLYYNERMISIWISYISYLGRNQHKWH